MTGLTYRNQLAVGALLFAALAITRGHHFASIAHVLPSASWAVFFLAGVYLRPTWALPTLLGVASLLDYVAIARGGGGCMSPAYLALMPAYTALWLAGRWYAGRCRLEPATLVPLAVAVISGSVACELISSGGFYFYSGRFQEPTWADFTQRLTLYFPRSLSSMAFWIGVAALIHVSVAALRARNTGHVQLP